MAIIKQLGIYNNNNWDTYEIGVETKNIIVNDTFTENSIIGINNEKKLFSLSPSDEYPTFDQLKYLHGIKSNLQGQIDNINEKINNNEWIMITDNGYYNLDDFTTVGRYFFNLENRDHLSNAPGINASNGWLEVLPAISRELDSDKIMVKQIWHRYGSTSLATTSGRSNYGEASYTDEYVRIYNSSTVQKWSPWARSVFVQENNGSYSQPKSQIHYKLITVSSLSINGNFTTLRIDSTNNPSAFKSYQIEGYSPFCLCSVDWNQGAHYVHMQAYEITNDSFWASFTNTGAAVTLENIQFGFMYIKDGTLWRPHN